MTVWQETRFTGHTEPIVAAQPSAEEQVRLHRLHRRHLLRPALMVGDAAAVAVLLLVSGGLGWTTYAVGLAAVLATVQGLGAYRSRLTLGVLDDLPALLGASLAAVAATYLVDSDRTLVVLSALREIAIVVVLLALVRTVVYAGVRTARRRGLIAHRTLVIGAGEVGRQVLQAAMEHPEHGLLPVGYLDDDPAPAALGLDVPHLGGLDDLARLVRSERISEVVITDQRPDSSLVATVQACDRLQVEVFAVPSHYELHHRSRDMDELWGLPLIRFRRAAWRNPAWRVKRAFDIASSGAALLVLAPLLLVVAAAVRLELGRGVIFSQVRVGFDGVPFTIYKFRSLRLPEGPGSQAVWSINGDARLGRVGRLIRATSIDELPQLVNVLRGDMSIVGPRPERPVFVDQFSAEVPHYGGRHRTPAGLTGWAQVNGLRGNTSIAERARFDNYYIQNWSLWLDAKIIARTVATVLLRHGS